MNGKGTGLTRSIIFGLLGTAALAGASPLPAQSDVGARYAHWETRLRNRVYGLLFYPAADNAVGDVLVGFRVGRDGKPTNIVIHKASGYEIFDRAAVRLVSNLGRIGPIPSTTGAVDEVVLKLSYGDPSSTIAQSMRLAKTDREDQLATERQNRALVSTVTHLAVKQ